MNYNENANYCIENSSYFPYMYINELDEKEIDNVLLFLKKHIGFEFESNTYYKNQIYCKMHIFGLYLTLEKNMYLVVKWDIHHDRIPFVPVLYTPDQFKKIFILKNRPDLNFNFIKKDGLVSAHRWFKLCDHPDDDCDNEKYNFYSDFGYRVLKRDIAGKIVSLFKTNDENKFKICKFCGNFMLEHGWINFNEPKKNRLVCPGDYVITTGNGLYYSCKPEEFDKQYNMLNDCIV